MIYSSNKFGSALNIRCLRDIECFGDGSLNGVDDMLIAGATAEIAREGGADVVV